MNGEEHCLKCSQKTNKSKARNMTLKFCRLLHKAASPTGVDKLTKVRAGASMLRQYKQEFLKPDLQEASSQFHRRNLLIYKFSQVSKVRCTSSIQTPEVGSANFICQNILLSHRYNLIFGNCVANQDLYIRLCMSFTEMNSEQNYSSMFYSQACPIESLCSCSGTWTGNQIKLCACCCLNKDITWRTGI